MNCGETPSLRPHRGALILTLGIAGLVFQWLGAAAWVMATNDMREMDRFEMDPSGLKLTKIGMTLGILACSVMVLIQYFLILGLLVGMVSWG